MTTSHLRLDAIFWDYPRFCDEAVLRSELARAAGTSASAWFLARFLENGRVVDVFRFFSLAEIARALPVLRLSDSARRKWQRMLSVYMPGG